MLFISGVPFSTIKMGSLGRWNSLLNKVLTCRFDKLLNCTRECDSIAYVFRIMKSCTTVNHEARCSTDNSPVKGLGSN